MTSRPREMALAKLAQHQLGLFTRSQASEIGLSRGLLASWVSSGRLHHVHPTVFAVGSAPQSFEQRALAACLAVPSAVAGFETAARLRRFSPLPPPLIVVTTRAETHRVAGIEVHRTNYLPIRHMGTVGSVPTTSVARTLLDLARVSGWNRLSENIDDQLTRRLVTMSELVEEFDAFATSGRRGTRRMRSMLASKADGSVVPTSELERRFHELLDSSDIRRPDTQFHPPWGGTLLGRVDVAYLEERLVVELDGRLWHSRDAAFETDRRRDQLALMSGWRTLRFTWTQVTRRPDEVLDTLRIVIAQ